MRNSNKNGFTLIETIIYIALVVGIVIAATTFAWNIINNRTKSFVIQEVEQNSRLIASKVSQSVRNATDITTPIVGASGTTLELVMRDAVNDPTSFTLSGGVLSMTQGVGSPIELHSGNVMVTNLSFENLSSAGGRVRNIKMTITLEHINPNSQIEWDYSNTFSLTAELRDR